MGELTEVDRMTFNDGENLPPLADANPGISISAKGRIRERTRRTGSPVHRRLHHAIATV